MAPEPQSTEPPQTLYPPHIRRWILGVVGGLAAFAIYVFGVRGEVILNGLAAVAAYCF
jgi:hypothetical protein